MLGNYPTALTIFVEPGSLDELERRLARPGHRIGDSDPARGSKWPAANWPRPIVYRLPGHQRRIDRAVDEICDILNQATRTVETSRND